MDLRTRLIAPSFRFQSDGRIGDFNLDAFIKCLLLFETYIIDSQGLTEIPYLVKAFTIDGLFLLLETGAIKLNCSFSHTGSLSSSVLPGQKVHFPFHYKFVTMEPAEINEYVNSLLKKIEPGMELTSRQTVHLRKAIYSSLERPEGNTDSFALKAMRNEIASSTQLLKSAMIIAMYKRSGVRVTPEDIEVAVQFDSENDFKAESNIQKRFDFDQLAAHQIIESSCLAIAKRNDRIEQMRKFSALTGFSDIDLPIFGDKLSFLASAITPNVDEKRFQRVIELNGLPQIKNDDNVHINAKKLLEIRESTESKEFRHWLATTDGMSDAEIVEQVRSLSKTIGRFIGGEAGQNIRFLITNSVGFIPIIGTAISMSLSILDHFLLDKFFPRSGVAAFIGDMYPSLFDKSTT